MLEFDINKLKFSNQHAQHYAVYYKPWAVDAEFNVEKLCNMKNMLKSACYSNLFSRYNNNTDENINGICIMNHIKPTGVKLEYDEIDRWIKLGIKYKMMPSHLDASKCILPDKANADNFYFVAAIKCEGVPQALLYLYLNTIRELYEDPGFVKSVLYLHETLGINYYAAYVFASFFNKTGTGHHILPITRTMSLYGSDDDANILKLKSIESNDPRSKLDLNIVRALYSFVNDPKVDKGYPLLRVCSKNTFRASSWNCIKKIVRIANKEIESGFKMGIAVHKLDNEHIDKIISTTSKEASQLITTIK